MTAIATPLYLALPQSDGRSYGRLCREKSDWIIRDGHPALLEMAKRVLPGCEHARASGLLKFKATRRAVGDLNWIMLRYPLTVEHPDRFEEDRQSAINHAVRRERNAKLPPAVPPATFNGELKPFQAEGVSFMIGNERTLLADDMGLGKTVQALAALATAEAFPALVVCPPNVMIQWRKMAEIFLRLPTDGLFIDNGRSFCQFMRGLKPHPLKPASIYITHYGLITAWRDAIRDIEPKAIIFDEVQDLRCDKTKKYSTASLIAGDARYVWGLSGTPLYNYGIEMWAITNIIDYHSMSDKESFSREWCTGYGTKIVEKPEVLNAYLREEGLMIRRLKSEVQDQLPPKRRVVHIIDHDQGVYSELIREAAAIADGYEGIHGFQERGKASLRIESDSRKATGVSKAKHVGDFVSALLEAGERPLVYAWHHDVHDAIRKAMGDLAVDGAMITGNETKLQKDVTIEAFRKGNLPYVQLSLRSTAGIDGLQEKATCVVFGELDWSPAVHAQCEDRAHRIGMGKLDSLLCYYLVSQTGYDSIIMDALGLKIGQFVGIMGDKPLTEDDKQKAIESGRQHLREVIAKIHANKGAA